MKSLSQLKATLTESIRMDEIALKTAAAVYKKRLENGQLTKAAKTGDLLKKKIDRELKEASMGSSNAWSLPTVLILHRKTIRNFSDGTKVALYYSDKINKYFSIPVRDETGMQHADPVTVSEDVNPQPLTYELDNNEVVTITEDEAHSLYSVYSSLTTENQEAFIENIMESPNKFYKILEFSKNQGIK